MVFVRITPGSRVCKNLQGKRLGVIGIPEIILIFYSSPTKIDVVLQSSIIQKRALRKILSINKIMSETNILTHRIKIFKLFNDFK